jgi:hypothetical protein
MQYGMRTHDGAMTKAQFDETGRAVDPSGQLSENAKLVARFDALTKYGYSRGDVKGAQAAAWSLMQHAAQGAQIQGQFALDALRQGDLKGASKFLERAYDWYPDGKRLEAFVGSDGRLHARTIDADNNVVDLGAFHASHVLKVTLGVANGTEFYNQMASIAGMKPKPEVKPEKAISSCSTNCE